MELLTVSVPKDFNLYQLGDVHVGTKAFAEDKFLKAVDIIRDDKQAKVVGVGDWVEGRCIDDDRFESDLNTTPTPYKQADAVISYLDPIKSKILTLLDGNHDQYSRRFGNLTQHICGERNLNVHYGTWSCRIIFKEKKTGKELFKSFFTHGSDRRSPCRSRSPISLRRKVNEKLSLIDILSPPFGDVLVSGCGHYHRTITYNPMEEKELYLVGDSEGIHQQYKAHSHDNGYIPVFERWYAASGAWQKQFVIGASSYAERALYAPATLGMIKWTIREGKPVNVEEIVP